MPSPTVYVTLAGALTRPSESVARTDAVTVTGPVTVRVSVGLADVTSTTPSPSVSNA